jgi:tetratricopeptide (TPR) repeat protein
MTPGKDFERRGPRKPPTGAKTSRNPRAQDRGRHTGSDRHSAKPRPAGKGAGAGTDAPVVHLSDDVVRELHATSRPGKGEILVKVFADAVTAYMLEDYEEAIRLGEQSKHMALRALAARELLGLAYYRAERWSEAARELSAFRRISGSTEQNAVLADCYRALKKPQRAVELCDEIDPARVEEAIVYEGAIVAAGALSDQGKLDDAIARLEQLELQPKVASEHHVRAWYLLGHLLETKGRFTQARNWFEAVAAADPDVTDAPERARRLARRS